MAKIPKLSIEIQPLGDRVIVLPQEAEQITASGIVIPDTAKGDKPHQGTVVALGNGDILNSDGKTTTDPHKFLKLGDTVLFGRYAGDDVKLKDEHNKEVEVKILHLDSILGKVL
jgi:chaperonin GroES